MNNNTGVDVLQVVGDILEDVVEHVLGWRGHDERLPQVHRISKALVTDINKSIRLSLGIALYIRKHDIRLATKANAKVFGRNRSCLRQSHLFRFVFRILEF